MNCAPDLERHDAAGSERFLVAEDPVAGRVSAAEHEARLARPACPANDLVFEEIVGPHGEVLIEGAAEKRIDEACRDQDELGGDHAPLVKAVEEAHVLPAIRQEALVERTREKVPGQGIAAPHGLFIDPEEVVQASARRILETGEAAVERPTHVLPDLAIVVAPALVLGGIEGSNNVLRDLHDVAVKREDLLGKERQPHERGNHPMGSAPLGELPPEEVCELRRWTGRKRPAVAVGTGEIEAILIASRESKASKRSEDEWIEDEVVPLGQRGA